MKKKTATAPRAARRPRVVPVMEPPALRPGTIDDLRGLDDVQRRKVIDFVASGVPISSIREDLEESYGFTLGDDGDAVLVEFYQEEARKRWQYTLDTASADADAMINVLRHSGFDFSDALVKALGQQAFRMITKQELDFKQVEKFTRLLLHARGQDNFRRHSQETLALQREKMERQFQSQLNKALDALAAEIKSNPEVRQYFDLFRAKLRESMLRRNPAKALALEPVPKPTPEEPESKI